MISKVLGLLAKMSRLINTCAFLPRTMSNKDLTASRQASNRPTDVNAVSGDDLDQSNEINFNVQLGPVMFVL